MAIKHKVKTAKFGTDFLGVFYKRRTYEERKYYIREIAHRGASFFRVFNCDKDNMEFEDYNALYWKNLEENLKLCFYEVTGKQMIIPILSLGGYWRINQTHLTQNQWEWVFDKAVDVCIKVLGYNFMVEIANEPKKAPNSFNYKPTKTGMPGQVQKLGEWHAYMTQLCMNKGLKIGQIMQNVIDIPDKGDPEIRDGIYYPKYAKTADMILGRVGKLKHRRDVLGSYHRIHFPADWHSKYAGQRINVTQVSSLWHGTNDGGSGIGEEGNGVDPSAMLTGRFKTIDKRELAKVSYASFRIAKDGIRHGKNTHKVMIWYADLGRDYFTWDITWYCKKCNYKKVLKGLTPDDPRPRIKACPDCGAKIHTIKKLIGDMNNIDYERIDVMERQYFKVFKKHSVNYGKFPEVIKPVDPKPIDPIEPEPEEPVEPINPKPKKEVKNMWWRIKNFASFIYRTITETNFPKWLKFISAILTIAFVIWILTVIF